MARKKKSKKVVNRGSDRRTAERRDIGYCSNDFWSKVENGFKKFLESPFKK